MNALILIIFSSKITTPLCEVQSTLQELKANIEMGWGMAIVRLLDHSEGSFWAERRCADIANCPLLIAFFFFFSLSLSAHVDGGLSGGSHMCKPLSTCERGPPSP